MKRTPLDKFAELKKEFVRTHMYDCQEVFKGHVEMGDHRRPIAISLLAQARMDIRYSPRTADIDIYMNLMKEWKKQKGIE